MDYERQLIIGFFITNIDVLAKIEEGHKLYLDKDNKIQLDEPYMFQGIWRYCNNVSRKDAINVINKLLNDMEIFFNALYLKTANKISRKIEPETNEYNTVQTIMNKLSIGVKGIENLKKTYSSDENICIELDRIIKKMKSLCNTFQIMISFY
jgi:hypothetical protein